MLVGSDADLTFDPFTLTNANQYSCEVTVNSTYLSTSLTDSTDPTNVVVTSE